MGRRREGKPMGKQERHHRSSMQSTNLLATLSQKTPLANLKQTKSWRDVKVRTKTTPLQRKGTIKKASLEASSLIFKDLLPLGREMPQEAPCRHTACAEHGRLQPRRGASCQELLCLGTKEQDFPPNKQSTASTYLIRAGNNKANRLKCLGKGGSHSWKLAVKHLSKMLSLDFVVFCPLQLQ